MQRYERYAVAVGIAFYLLLLGLSFVPTSCAGLSKGGRALQVYALTEIALLLVITIAYQAEDKRDGRCLACGPPFLATYMLLAVHVFTSVAFMIGLGIASYVERACLQQHWGFAAVVGVGALVPFAAWSWLAVRALKASREPQYIRV